MRTLYMQRVSCDSFQSSFSFLKTLLMLSFGIDAPWQVQKGQKNAYVFNTEAHPMRVSHT